MCVRVRVRVREKKRESVCECVGAWVDKEQKICPTYINVCSSQVKAFLVFYYFYSIVAVADVVVVAVADIVVDVVVVPENFNWNREQVILVVATFLRRF